MQYRAKLKNFRNTKISNTLDLEIIILTKSDRERQIPYDSTYMWNLKHDINELIYETEMDSHREQTCGCQGKRVAGGMD